MTRINLQGYYKVLGSRSPSTKEAYMYTVKKFERFLKGKEPNQVLAEEYLDTFFDKGNGARSVMRHLTALRHLFKWMDIELRTEGPHMEKSLPPYITEAEFHLMMEKAWNPKLKAAIALMFGGGLRLSETLNLKIEDVSPEGYLRVMGKGSKEALVPVEEEILEFIEEWKGIVRLRSKYLFPGQFDNQPQKRSGFQKMIKSHMKACGFGEKRVHSLRHGAATSLYERGLDLKQIQEFMRHENLNTTMLYTHLSPSRLREDIIRVKRFGKGKK